MYTVSYNIAEGILQLGVNCVPSTLINNTVTCYWKSTWQHVARALVAAITIDNSKLSVACTQSTISNTNNTRACSFYRKFTHIAKHTKQVEDLRASW